MDGRRRSGVDARDAVAPESRRAVDGGSPGVRSPLPRRRRTAGGFFLLNGRAARKVGAGEVFLAAENLTDERYEYRPGYPMPGINAMAGLNWSF